MVCHYLAMFGSHWPSTSGNIKYLMSRDPTKPRDKESCNFMRGSSSWYVKSSDYIDRSPSR